MLARLFASSVPYCRGGWMDWKKSLDDTPQACRVVCGSRRSSSALTRHRTEATELVLQQLALQPEALARALHDGAARRRFTAHEQRYAEDTLVRHDGNFTGRPIGHDVEQRETMDVVGKYT